MIKYKKYNKDSRYNNNIDDMDKIKNIR